MSSKNELHINKLKIDHTGDVTGTGSKLLTDSDPVISSGNLTLSSTPPVADSAISKAYVDALVGSGVLTNRQIMKRISHRR